MANHFGGIKFTNNTTSQAFDLLTVDEAGRRALTIEERPPSPRVATRAQTALGLNPFEKLTFDMTDWQWGHGLEEFDPELTHKAARARYQDGYAIDTSVRGKVLHGPDVTTMSSTGDNPRQFILYNDDIYVLTITKLYHWTGAAWNLDWTVPGGGTTNNMVVYDGSLYVSANDPGNPTHYWYWNGAVMTQKAVPAGTADWFHVVSDANGSQLVATYSDNYIQRSVDPVTPTWTAGIQIGHDGDTINNIFTVNGYMFIGTERTLYMLGEDDRVFDVDDRLANRASTDSYSVADQIMSEAWFSDQTWRLQQLVAVGENEYDLRQGGPFRDSEFWPFSALDTIGNIKNIAFDQDAVYVSVLRSGTTTYIYKGVEVSRGQYSWSPIVGNFSGATNGMSVIKETSGKPWLIWASGVSIYYIEVDEADWGPYEADWVMITPYFDAGLPQWNKLWHTLEVYLEREANTKVTCYYEIDGGGWTLFGATGICQTNGHNSLSLSTPISGKRVRLKFAGNTTNSSNKVNLLSFQLTGALKPPKKMTIDATVVVENDTEMTFLEGLRDTTSYFIVVEDDLGNTYNCTVQAGFPSLHYMYDEARGDVVHAARMVLVEV